MMINQSPFRLAGFAGAVLLAGLLMEGGAWAQGGGLPPMSPTGQAASPSSNSVATGVTSRGPKRAEVVYTGGLLHVTAGNSSLNQILREIGRLTGMKITGGVQDDRVFGTYGPAPASEVLAKLLDGTASNFLIVENDQAGPAELVLTQRRGGASPPNPNAAIAEEQDREPQQPQSNQQNSQGFFLNGKGQPQPGNGGPGAGGLPPSNGGQTGAPVSGGANLGTTPGAFAGFGQTPTDATAQPAAGNSAVDASEPQSSNGVSTPQQIYEQLQKLRQQQQATPAPAPQ